MLHQTQLSEEKIIDCIAVIDIDPALTHFKPIQQKWISSLQLYSQSPKDIKPGSKLILITFGLYLVINYCQKNRLPIYQIDFITQPDSEWIPLKMPHNFHDKFNDSYLCYKTEQLQLMQPLGDIDVINTEKKNHLGHDKEVLNVPNGYKVLSSPIMQNYLIYKRIKSRLEYTFKPIILQHYPQQIQNSLSLIPQFCFPEGIKLSKQLKGFITFTFILTQSNGDRLYVTYLTFKQLLNENLKNKLNVKYIDNIYYDKGFCLISKFNFSDQFSECLQHLYRLSMSKNDQPFHKVIQNFVNELKLPKQIKKYGFSYSYNGCNINFEYDPVIPSISDRSIYCIFKFLPLEQILNVFKAILYERKIIFVSQSKTIIGYAFQAFLSLIFPFKWENVILPIVPITMKEYLTAPVPFIAGITTTQLIDTSFESETVIVLLDSGKVMNDEDMPPLPQKLAKQLIKKLEQYEIYNPQEVREYLENPQNTYMFKMMQVQNPEFKPLLIRDSFLQFFATLMKNYKKYWKSKFLKDLKDTFSMQSTQPQLLNDMFKVQDFLSDLGMNKVGSFGYKFTEGTIFSAFLQRRYSNNADVIANFFDECLQKKKSKKSEGILIIREQKLRYLVTKHLQPEKQKNFYIYDRFPSIFPEPTSKQILNQQIELKIQEDDLISQNQFYEFIQDQRQLTYGMFELIKPGEIKQDQHIEIMNLFTNKNKQLFLQQKNLKSRKGIKIFQIFKQIYMIQKNQIKRLFEQWPKFESQSKNHICYEKQKYFALKLQNKLPIQNNDMILSIWQGTNLQMIIKGSIKILITSQFNQISTVSSSRRSSLLNSTSLTASTLNKPRRISLYIPNYQIRQLLNSIFQNQAKEIFNFIYTQVKNGSDNCWNIETLIDLRIYLQKVQSGKLQESQLRMS